jgi:hypothetical protein
MGEVKYREIPLSKGLSATVDADNYERFNDLKWFARFDATSGLYYAEAALSKNGKTVKISMSRMVLGLEKGDRRHADHIQPHLTLVNTRENLRIADLFESAQNRRSRAGKSGYRGVHPAPDAKNRFRAQLQSKNKVYFGPSRPSREEAYQDYCDMAKKHHGDFARPEAR